MNDIISITKKRARNIRETILRSLTEAGSGHLGGSVDLADLFSVLYFNEMNYDINNPQWEERDRLILSIGHTAPVLYATLAEAGFYPKDLFILLAKNRLVADWQVKNQKNARKFHSYFWVFEKSNKVIEYV